MSFFYFAKNKKFYLIIGISCFIFGIAVSLLPDMEPVNRLMVLTAIVAAIAVVNFIFIKLLKLKFNK